MSQRLQPPLPRNAAHGDKGCPLHRAHHQPVQDRWDGRYPQSPSPSWLTATGTITDYFPITLSTHRNAELDTHSGVFFPLRSHAHPRNLQRNVRLLSQRSRPNAGMDRAQHGPQAGGQPELRSCGHGAAISCRTRGWRGHGFANTGGERQRIAKSC